MNITTQDSHYTLNQNGLKADDWSKMYSGICKICIGTIAMENKWEAY